MAPSVDSSPPRSPCSSPRSAPALAYVRTVIGGRVMNLDKLRRLGAPIASIGGAGTFDGVFLTGIIAVLHA